MNFIKKQHDFKNVYGYVVTVAGMIYMKTYTIQLQNELV